MPAHGASSIVRTSALVQILSRSWMCCESFAKKKKFLDIKGPPFHWEANVEMCWPKIEPFTVTNGINTPCNHWPEAILDEYCIWSKAIQGREHQKTVTVLGVIPTLRAIWKKAGRQDTCIDRLSWQTLPDMCSDASSIIKAGKCSGLCSDVLVAMCSEICPLKSDMCSDISSGMYFWHVLSHQTGICSDMYCDICSDFGSVLPCIPTFVLPSISPLAPTYVLT